MLMLSRWLSWLNYTLAAISLLLVMAGIAYWIKQPGEIECSNLRTKECGLPKNAFELKAEDYHQIGDSLLALQETPPTMQLPDLKQQLIYYGKNGRPDAQSENTMLHFSITGNNKTVASIAPKEKLYLVFDRKTTPGKYTFSPKNEKTSLWIEASLIDNDVQVQVAMEKENGERITEPAAFAEFRLPEKEFNRFAGNNWEIGSFKVDASLLVRQKARWYGIDRFLEHHGGDEFKDAAGKHRIDFSENDELYSVFINLNDCLIWDQNRWQVVVPGEASKQHPLLVAKRIDERIMSFELWDTEGKGKVTLNLLKSTEPWTVQNAQTLQNMFKFLGARTRTQCVFEINKERVILRPSDWLLLTPKGWQKLSSEEEIDKYVKRKLTGTLFVFDGIVRKDEKQMMKGTLYSPARHDSQTIELALEVSKKKPAAQAAQAAQGMTKEALEEKARTAAAEMMRRNAAASSASTASPK